MSQFEYVSVAIALVYAIAVARIVGALPAIVEVERRYWVHTGWAFVLLLAAVSTWWTIWNLRSVEWTPFRFLWALTVPALIHIRAGILVSEDPAAVRRWRVHYFESRLPFFFIGVVIALNGAVLPWIMGLAPWPFIPIQASWAALLVISSLGLLSAKPSLHVALVACNMLMIISSMAVQSLNGRGGG